MNPRRTGHPSGPDSPGGTWQREGLLLTALVALAFVGRLALAARVGVAPDEAYYWGWAKTPAWGYPDHPPAVAWLLTPVVSRAAGNALWLRLPALVAGGLLLPLLLWWLARECGISRGRRWWLPLASTVQPLGLAAGLFITPDVPLLVAWTACVLCFLRALRRDQWWAWALTGLLAGCALLSKHSGWILFGSLGLALWAEARPWPRGRWVRVATATALGLLVAAPNLWWDARGGFASVGFQLAHGFAPSDVVGAPLRLMEYIGGQVGLLTPLVAVGAGWFLWVGRFGTPVERRLWRLAWPPLALFAAAALMAHPEANWPAPAHPLLLTGMLACWDRRHPTPVPAGPRRRLPLLAATVSLAFSLAAVAHLVRPWPFFPPPFEPAARLRGWGNLPSWLAEESDIFAVDYELAAALTFHLPGPQAVRNRCPQQSELVSALLVVAAPGTERPQRPGLDPRAGPTPPHGPPGEGGDPPAEGAPGEAHCAPGAGRCWVPGSWAPLRRRDGQVVRTLQAFRSEPCGDRRQTAHQGVVPRGSEVAWR